MTTSARCLRGFPGENVLPETIKVLERGWLSSNNVVLFGRAGVAMVDSGYVSHAEQTLALLEHALAGGRLSWLLNTHCHSDHMGGNAALQARYACRTSIPAGEAALIDAWDEGALVLAFADQRCDRFGYDDTFAPGDTLSLGGLAWQVIAAPGHDPRAVLFYSPEERILISGDALWENGFGVVFPRLFGDEQALAEARRTLESIAALDVRLVVPGHGRPFTEVVPALERAFGRVAAYEKDVTRLARHALKVLLTFALLEKRSLPLAALPQYLERVPIYHAINRPFLGMSAAGLADYLVRDLERAGVLRREAGNVVISG